jgi:hypothetical protein
VGSGRGSWFGVRIAVLPYPRKPAHETHEHVSDTDWRLPFAGACAPERGVSVSVLRKNRFRLGGVEARSETNLLTTVEFKPLGGDRAAVVRDFALLADEIQPVKRVMRARGWFVGCLYNQETDEHPQLYFSHQLKTGDAYRLAHKVGTALTTPGRNSGFWERGRGYLRITMRFRGERR